MKKLPKQVKSALEKTRDSAILAVEVYNKPAVKFKSSLSNGNSVDVFFSCCFL